MSKKANRGIILLAVAILGFFAVVRPQTGVFAERSLEAKIKSEEVRSYEQRIEDLKFIRDRGATVQSVLTAQYLAMPRSSQIPEVLVMVESLAASAGVVLGNATIGTPSANEVPVTISFTGNIGSVNGFLNALNQNIRTVVVKDQTLVSDDGGNVNLNLSLGLIYQGGK